MVVFELDKVEIDHCVSCGGSWFDKGEMDLLSEDPKEEELFQAHFNQKLLSGEKPRRCPICLKRMRKLLYEDAHRQICVDRCPKCEGIWFDRGELETVIKSQRAEGKNKVFKQLQSVFNGNRNLGGT